MKFSPHKVMQGAMRRMVRQTVHFVVGRPSLYRVALRVRKNMPGLEIWVRRHMNPVYRHSSAVSDEINVVMLTSTDTHAVQAQLQQAFRRLK